MKDLKGKIVKLKGRIPVSIRKTVKVLTYALLATLLSFGAAYVATEEVNMEELEAVLRTYGYNVIMAFAVFYKTKSK